MPHLLNEAALRFTKLFCTVLRRRQ